MDGNTPRQRLLDASIDWVAAHGIGELSLRQLAAELGTSHRMLIFHFGSKEKLWIEIVRTVEERQREQLRAQLPDPGKPVGEALWTWWKHISDRSLWANERLFFELYGQALQGRPHAVEFLDGIVEDWIEPVAQASIARGVPELLARAQARLGVAVTRGLLLDLLATGDTDAVDQAMAAFIALCETWVQHVDGDQADASPQQ
ncbi:MAG: TetR/AcrR family transcriptional regulator [Solirubrobacteraceae bacterium]|jgi:AcrR family transcriptional regulator